MKTSPDAPDAVRVQVTPYALGGPYRVDLIDVRTGATLASLDVSAAILLSDRLHREALVAIDVGAQTGKVAADGEYA